MRAGEVLISAIWTETLPERRVELERTLAEANGDPGFEVTWIGSQDTDESGVRDRYYRPDATPLAGLSNRRAWMALRRNVQTTLGSSRRRAGLIARVAAAWNLMSGRGLKIDAPPSAQSDDVTRKHLVALDRFTDSGANWLLGLEDDAIGEPGWPRRVATIVESLSKSDEVPIYIAASEGAGLGRTSSDPAPDSLGLFEVKPPATRTSCAYLMNREAADRVRAALASSGIHEGVGASMDLLVTFVAVKCSIRTLWTEPPPFAHGSEGEDPSFVSSIPRSRG